jgi:hypothetical protein
MSASVFDSPAIGVAAVPRLRLWPSRPGVAEWTWLGFLAGLIAKVIVSPLKHTTFPLFHQSAVNWRVGIDPYAASEFEYRYSPLFTVLFSPLSWLPVEVGGVLWSIFNVSVLWWAVHLLMEDVLPKRPTGLRRDFFLLLVLAVSARGLWAAQCNTLIIAMACGAASCASRGHWCRAALLTAFPVYIKVWPVALAMLATACWPKRFGLSFLLWMAFLGVLPFAAQSPAFVASQYGQFFEGLTGPMQVRHIYRDAWTVWEYFAPPVSEGGYRLVQLATAGLVCLACLFQTRRDPDVRRGWLYILSVWTSWQLLFGPGSERNTFCLIAPFAAWAVLGSVRGRQGLWLALPGVTLITLFSFGMFERKLDRYFDGAILALPLGVALTASWFLLYLSPRDRWFPFGLRRTTRSV